MYTYRRFDLRLDKFLKVNGIIKRRVIAKEAIDKGYVARNNVPAKPSSELKPGDVVSISFSNRTLVVRVTEGFLSEVIRETRE